MNPRVSIVINNFNYSRFLPQSIESALAQTYPQTEVVVVDDCSTDDSRNIIRSYVDQVIPVLQEKNEGQAAAMNAGFAASHGELIIFLDADDYLYATAAETAVAALGPGVGCIQYRLHLVDSIGNRVDLYPAPEIAFDSGNVVPKLLATGRYQGTVTSGNAFARGTLLAIMPISRRTIPHQRRRVPGDLRTLPRFGGQHRGTSGRVSHARRQPVDERSVFGKTTPTVDPARPRQAQGLARTGGCRRSRRRRGAWAQRLSAPREAARFVVPGGR